MIFMGVLTRRVLPILLFMTMISEVRGESVYSLDSCRTLAIRNNKSIRIADESIKGAEYNKKAAFSAYLPGIDFTATYLYNQHDISLLGEDAKLPTMKFDAATQSYQYNILTNPQTGQPILNPRTGEPIPAEVAVIPKSAMTYDIEHVVAGAITLTQPVYMGGKIRAMNEITKYAEELAVNAKNMRVQEIVYQVDEAYWQIVSLKAKKRLAESYLNLIDSLRADVVEMFEVGIATKSDVLNVEVKQNEAEIMLSKVDNGLSLSRMSLARICGLPISAEMRLADEDTAGTITISELYGEYDMADVYSRRYDIQSLKTGVKIYEQKERLAKSEMLPKLAIVGAYTFQNPNTIDGFSNRFGGGFHVGATLSVPLWHWGGNYNRYRAAKSETNIRRIQLEEAEELVELQVTQAKYKYDESIKTYRMADKNLAKAEENLRCAELGFEEGVMTSDDVMKAQSAWLQAKSEKIDSQIDLQLCEVYLSKAIGRMNY